MKRTEREQARCITAYVDEVLLRRRADEASADPLSPEDQELERLGALAQCLSDIEVVPSSGFREDLAQRLREAAAEEAASDAGTRSWLTRATDAVRLGPFSRDRNFGRAASNAYTQVRTALASIPGSVVRTAMLVLVIGSGIVVLSRAVIDVPVVSAQEVLSRSDAALTGLVGPGQVLYRQWKVTSTGAPGALSGESPSERIIEEWMDGADFDRVAGRWYSKDKELQIAYTTRFQDGEYRPYVYFSPGVYDEQRGVLNIEPTRHEFEAALSTFSETAQRGLRLYLDRHYIYAPITGERSFNKAIVEAPALSVPEMPRILVSFDASHLLNATPVYRVRLLDSASVTFNWRSSGPPLIRLAQAEIVRYMARDSFLSVRTDERLILEDGRRRSTTRELVTTKALERAFLPADPFAIDVPPGTPVQQQSAVEHLAGVASVLERVPAFTSRLSRESGAATENPE